MTDSSVITQILRPLKFVMAPKIQVRQRHVLRRYPTTFLRKISDAFSNEYLGRACVAGTLKRISYEIYLELRKYVDSHTSIGRSCYELQTNLVMIYHYVAFYHKIPNKNFMSTVIISIRKFLRT